MIADLDNDKKLDVILVNAAAGNGSISVLLGRGDGSFQTPVQYPTSVGTTSLTVADLNADGIPDVVVANHDTSFVTTNRCARESGFDRKNFIRKLLRDIPVKRNSYSEFLRWLQCRKTQSLK